MNNDLIPGEYVCIDTETTGLNPDSDEILEVAAIRFNRSGEVLGTFYEMCSPMSRNIPVEASNIHGITMDKVASCPPYSECRPALAAFIGKRVLIGHNLKSFDIKFLKITPVVMEDTLEMCRSIWPGKNRLSNACKRVGLKFDEKEGHGALYDTQKCMELYLTLKSLETKNTIDSVAPTQVYSFSRINQFLSCPYKWKQTYLLKNKEPNQPYFVVGRAIHKIAQLSAVWCYMKTFANKFCVYAQIEKWVVPVDLIKLMEPELGKAFYLPTKKEDITLSHIGMFLYRNNSYINTFFGKTIIDMIQSMNVNEGEYEIVGMPPEDVYSRIIQLSLVMERCTDPDMVKDVSYLADYFYKQRDFTMQSGEVALVEKQLIFDKDWNILKDWFDNTGYMRGAIDVLEYNGEDHVTIIDYKSGRKMLNEAQLRNDLQLKVYVLFVHKFLPTVTTITIKHHYIRFGKVVKFHIENVEAMANEAEQWIRSSIDEIEREMLKPDNEAFKPERNEYCSSCYLMESNQCPLFNVKNINDIKDPANFVIKNVDDLRQAWKKIEVNKAEVKNLTNKCKEFVRSCQGRISIDSNAVIDFWVKEKVEYDALQTAKLLLKKEADIAVILNYMGISNEELNKLLKKLKIELTEDEIKSISFKKTATTFDAFTKKEVEDAGYLNQ